MYAVERVCKDQRSLKQLWVSDEVTAWLEESYATRQFKGEYNALNRVLINNPTMWARLEALVKVTVPIRIALRSTDTDEPNLHLVAEQYASGAIPCLLRGRNIEFKSIQIPKP